MNSLAVVQKAVELLLHGSMTMLAIVATIFLVAYLKGRMQ